MKGLKQVTKFKHPCPDLAKASAITRTTIKSWAETWRTEIFLKDLQIFDPTEMPQGDRGEGLSKKNTDIPTPVLTGPSHGGMTFCLVGTWFSQGSGSGASREHAQHLVKCFRKSSLTGQKQKSETKAPIRPLNQLRHRHNAYKAEVSFIPTDFVLHHSSKSHRLQVPPSQWTKTKHHLGVLNT